MIAAPAYQFTQLLLRSAVLAVCLLVAAGEARVIRMSSNAAQPQSVVNSCAAGDVLLFDISSSPSLSDPPSGIQIVSGSAKWTFTKEISDLVFFNHKAEIKQTGGKLRRVIGNAGCGYSSFTHIDSCFFITHLSAASRYIQANGFLRACTFGSGGEFMGSSTVTLWHERLKTGCMDKSAQCGQTWTNHRSNFLINATDPVGDGSGTLLANWVSHGQVDWTPVHIINGRGIAVAHLNSEYCDWSDPFVMIENGVECAVIANNIGGHGGSIAWDAMITLTDGVPMASFMTTRLAAWRIGGMNNSLISGGNYTASRTTVTGSAWSSCLARDPYITKWRPGHGSGINYAPGIRVTSFRNVDRSMVKENEIGYNSYTFSTAAQCTTAFIDSKGALIQTGLKTGGLRTGPATIAPYTPQFPRIKLDGDGPGTNMSKNTGAEILAAVNSGKTIYLDTGTYNIPGTMRGGKVWGAGKDETILKFPSGGHATDMPISLYNLTIEGGTVGSAQIQFGQYLTAANIRFRGQSICGVTHGNAEQKSISFIEFDNCVTGIATCADGIPCSSGGKKYDKFYVYNCIFKNLTTGANISGGTDGFASFIGCRFENISGTALNLQSDGNYVAGCTFSNCGAATKCMYNMTVTSCSVTGTSSQTGIADASEVISCTITGCEPSVTVKTDYAVVSDVIATGSITKKSNTWVGMSTFKNLDVRTGAAYGSNDLSKYVDATSVRIDQTPPTAPADLKVDASGSNNLLTWSKSTDPESYVMQYIIERDGQEIGRTNWNYTADYHYIHASGWKNGWPGAGVYRDPRPVYVDSGAAGKFSLSNYKVVAVNFAQIRSDNEMARLRLWHHEVFPWRVSGVDASGSPVKLTDSVRVPLGPLTTTPANGSLSFTAVRYRPLSGSGLFAGPVAVDPSNRRIRHSGLALPVPLGKTVAVYNLKGARVASISSDVRIVARSLLDCHLPSGVYMVPELGKSYTITARR